MIGEKIVWKRIIASVLRHALTAAGAIDVVTDDELGKLSGAVLILLGMGWSALQKRRSERELKEAKDEAVKPLLGRHR